ncbi:MAG: tRNA (adenosine(37)-N6)-threonylcarbamoyltransferase complex dimerization subunit type 1 TsaB [Candidatus Muproteobacteria bacterium RBG_16_65_31]|uniref:tRNA threonylcarbamoyladenosine biosynthesis protein TsaB n=1 Tax=Candidatus Muproteobacteria bacterium RBG_16_65_31 TaxID=1817759 RepID=A0A1F6TGC0_9PROT|nr:MAG: tRNA (adenosine(37)-N6)-threonylcarbamoyltransferase complex dimerization subunit type 1 TsaB [Candidatus Muproteobacteria bacterium RBG_16_65_31]
MKLLALDTATEACSVAVWADGATVERLELGSQHSERILPMVQEVLAEAGLGLKQLDAIAFGRGPGSFTGLRIGAGVTQGLAFGADLPVVPVSSLAALAQGVDAPKVLAAFDARMQQVYWGAYVRNAQGLMWLQGGEIVIAPKDVPPPDGDGWTGAGSGWDQYAGALSLRLGDKAKEWRRQCFPRARHVAELGAAAFRAGQAVPPEQALPVYVRDEVAVKKSPAQT